MLSRECFAGFSGDLSCQAGDAGLIYVAVGALGGVVPALPVFATSQLYSHLAALERARA